MGEGRKGKAGKIESDDSKRDPKKRSNNDGVGKGKGLESEKAGRKDVG